MTLSPIRSFHWLKPYTSTLRFLLIAFALLQISCATALVISDTDDDVFDGGSDGRLDSNDDGGADADEGIEDSGGDSGVDGDGGEPDGEPDSEPDGEPDSEPDTDVDDTPSGCLSALEATATDFEAGSAGYTNHILDNASAAWTFDLWEYGEATVPVSCSSGTRCWATNLDDNYIQCQRAELRSPELDLSPCQGTPLKLVFDHYYDFWTDTYEGWTYYDGGTVELSTNGGDTWTVPSTYTFPGTIEINPEMGGFLDNYACVSPDNFHVDGLQGFTGANSGWETVEIPIPGALVSSRFVLRFAYSTGVSYETTSEATSMLHARPGWYIDDIEIVLDE